VAASCHGVGLRRCEAVARRRAGEGEDELLEVGREARRLPQHS
jgi:hypothetical protein